MSGIRLIRPYLSSREFKGVYTCMIIMFIKYILHEDYTRGEGGEGKGCSHIARLRRGVDPVSWYWGLIY